MTSFPFFIAKRYLVSKKSTNVINWISGISVFGITIGTMAMIIILAVFSGLDTLIKSMFSSFNPEIEITAAAGKRFEPSEHLLDLLTNHKDIAAFSKVLEDNALVKYDRKEMLVLIKGVDHHYSRVSGMDTSIMDGEFILNNQNEMFAIIGKGVAINLSIGLNFIAPLICYYPKSDINIHQIDRSINREIIFPSAIFELHNEIDYQYVLVPIEFTQSLFDEFVNISAIEIKTKTPNQLNSIINNLQQELGEDFLVKDRMEQQELLFKTVQSEKLISFLILAFVVLIATFNIIGSLTMLIIDKKNDVRSLMNLGASLGDIRKIFLFEGWLISLVGMLAGTLMGLIVCFLQDTLGLVPLGAQGDFLVQYYPVEVRWEDVTKTMLSVGFIGFIAAWFPVRILTKRYL